MCRRDIAVVFLLQTCELSLDYRFLVCNYCHMMDDVVLPLQNENGRDIFEDLGQTLLELKKMVWALFLG